MIFKYKHFKTCITYCIFVHLFPSPYTQSNPVVLGDLQFQLELSSKTYY